MSTVPQHPGATTPQPWDEAPLLILPAIACPFCRARLQGIRTEKSGDGARTRRFVCTRCLRRARVAYEPIDDSDAEWIFFAPLPESGREDDRG